MAKDSGLKIEERKFSYEEMLRAQEVFLTSSSLIIRPITKIDGKIISDGKSRKVAQTLNFSYADFLRKN
jgi:D-alanine transaminase